MSRYGVTEEDISRESEQDDRNYELVRKGCLHGDIGCFGCLLHAPAVGFLLLLPAWLLGA